MSASVVMTRAVQCYRCKTDMKVAYIRVEKKWKRAAWVCPRCFSVENSLGRDFKNDKRVHYQGSNPYVNPQEAYQKGNETEVKAT